MIARIRTIRGLAPGVLALLVLGAVLGAIAAPPADAARVADLTTHQGDVPRRLVGYGLVTGLDGSGDRSFGGASSNTPTVRSVVNLLRRFNVEVPPDRLRLRNVAAVLVTAEVSPFLRAGGRFEVQVTALSDASSLRGGVLWTTPLVTDPNQPPVATAQGPLFVALDDLGKNASMRRSNAGRIDQGGILEVDPPPTALGSRLLLKSPDLGTASRTAAAINAAFKGAVAKAEDAGAIALTPGAGATDVTTFLAAVDTVDVPVVARSRIIIDGRQGTVVAGGDVRVAAAAVSHRGITLQIGGTPTATSARAVGLVQLGTDASVEDVAAGLHAAGAAPQEIAAIFEALEAAGALTAEVVVR